jgi:hypothetical protein
MTDVVEVALIMSAPSTLAAIFGLYNSIIVRRTERHALETTLAMTLLEKNTNSIKDELVKVTHNEAYAAGRLDQKQRTDEIASAVKDASQGIPSVIIRQEGDLK